MQRAAERNRALDRGPRITTYLHAAHTSCGCHLGAMIRCAYQKPQVAHEAMLLWYLDL